MDNVIAFNVVLPNGTPVTATKDKYADLFWALKVRSQRQNPNLCSYRDGANRAEETTSYVIGLTRITEV